MRILDIYIAKSVIAGTAIALFALSALDVFFALISELDDVGQGHYQIEDAFIYIFYTLPRRIYEYFPAAILVGSLLSLGALASNSELVAIRAAGVSIKRIIWSAVQASLVMMVIIIFLGEFLVPPSEQYAESMRHSKQTGQVSKFGNDNIWIRYKNMFINIEKAYPNHRMKNMTIYEMGDDRLIKKMTVAKSAMYEKDYWFLKDIQEKAFSPEGITITENSHKQRYDLVSSDLLRITNIEPVNMAARDLYEYVSYLKDNKLDASNYQLAFWMKITMPLSSIVMLLLALPFVFGFLRTVSAGQLVMIGILLGLTFYIVTRIASNIGQIYALPPFVSAIFPVLLVMVGSMIALRRIR